MRDSDSLRPTAIPAEFIPLTLASGKKVWVWGLENVPEGGTARPDSQPDPQPPAGSAQPAQPPAASRV